MSQLISIIVPAYNTAPWLKRCLDSLLNQTYENLEIIVVNDGSQDDTAAVLDCCAEESSRIRAIHQENSGVTAARLRGLREAKGDWIGFVDGDDVVEPDMYQRLLDNAGTYGADISHCGQQVIFPDGRVTTIQNDGMLRQQDHLTALRDLLDGGLIESGLCTKLYKKELFTGLADWMDMSLRHNEDLLMNFYLFNQAEKSVFQAICPYHYILRPGSASYSGVKTEKIRDPILAREKILNDCDESLRQDARQALMRNCLFGYAQLAMEPKTRLEAERKLVRQKLRDQRAYFPLLSGRNRILANLIVTAPWAFTLAYRAFLTLTGKQEEH